MKNRILLGLLLISMISYSQQTDIVDFLSIEAQVQPVVSEKSIKGVVKVSFKMLQPANSVYLDGVEMIVKEEDSPSVTVATRVNKIWLSGDFKEGEVYTSTFSYIAVPKQTLYFTGEQIWTQGQGKYTSHWLPSLDDMNDKIEFDLSVITSEEKTVVANGKLVGVTKDIEGRKWTFNMENPMSSYLVAMVIGDYNRKSFFTKSNVQITVYHTPSDVANVEPTYRYTQEIFEFLEDEIGVSYPWQNYKQIPVRDFLYAGMENTTATIFSEAFVVDSIGFVDRNYVNVNAHELAHQWFGNLITETSGTHHWLQEGFATYYAILAEREIFGDDYYYWKLYQTAEQLRELSDEGKGESLLNPKASSLTFYEKGAWALHILKEDIGETAFKQAVQAYLEKYQFKNVTTQDFLNEVEIASGKSMKEFEADWLKQSAFKAEQAYQSLIQSEFMKQFFRISALRSTAIAEKSSELSGALTFPNDFIGQEAIYQLIGEPPSETASLYKKGFESNNLFVRQAIANTLSTIPEELRLDYESLLKDESYITQEAALYNLWINFPKHRTAYLDQMSEVIGFRDKNIRQLWLVLALVTEGYRQNNKQDYLKEMVSYTSPEHSFEIRERAFGYLNELQVFPRESINYLVDACVHHNWRFRNAARTILDTVLANEAYKQQITKSFDSFSEKEKKFLNAKLFN